MNRRRFLGIGLGSATALAGCIGTTDGEPADGTPATDEADSGIQTGTVVFDESATQLSVTPVELAAGETMHITVEVVEGNGAFTVVIGPPDTPKEHYERTPYIEERYSESHEAAQPGEYIVEVVRSVEAETRMDVRIAVE